MSMDTPVGEGLTPEQEEFIRKGPAMAPEHMGSYGPLFRAALATIDSLRGELAVARTQADDWQDRAALKADALGEARDLLVSKSAEVERLTRLVEKADEMLEHHDAMCSNTGFCGTADRYRDLREGREK